MPVSPADFAEDTSFERSVLDLLGTHRIEIQEPSSTHDIRGRVDGVGGNTTVQVGMIDSAFGGREELRRPLRPLGFAAAYKVLDLLIEHVLRDNGAVFGRMRFDQKVAALAQRPVTLPVPFDGRPELWDRLAVLYICFQEPRHAATHRRAQVSDEGDLQSYDDGVLTDTVSGAEIAAFAAAVHGTAELVIESRADDRRLNVVAWHLNDLQGRHGLATLSGAQDPSAGRRRLVMDLTELPDGQLRFDVPLAKRDAIDFQQPSLWDLHLHAGSRVFVGHWEDLPTHDEPIDFSPVALPGWLSEQLPE
jgi:hypothetical protein